MHTVWREFLQNQGAVFDEGGWIDSFGDPQRELEAADAKLICDLSFFGLIRVAGPDAEKFLQGQFSNDIRDVTATRFQLSTYSNPKGRLLANFMIHRWQDAYWLQPWADLGAPLTERLQKYRLMAKAEIEECSDPWVRIGMTGSLPRKVLDPDLLPDAPFASRSSAEFVVLRLPWTTMPAYCLMGKAETLRTVWERAVTSEARPVGARVWRLLQIRAGVPFVQKATCEEFIPQELNQETLGAINFKKGCYPGQEIVARTKYLGRLKSNTYRLQSPVSAAPGTDIFGTSLAGQAIGKLLDAAPNGEGAYEALAVLRNENAREILRLGSEDGPELTLLDLPYPL